MRVARRDQPVRLEIFARIGIEWDVISIQICLRVARGSLDSCLFKVCRAFNRAAIARARPVCLLSGARTRPVADGVID